MLAFEDAVVAASGLVSGSFFLIFFLFNVILEGKASSTLSPPSSLFEIEDRLTLR